MAFKALLSEENPAGLEPMGTNKDGQDIGFVVDHSNLVLVTAFTNGSNEPQSYKYTKTEGTTNEYAQEMGVSVTASAGVSIKVVEASVSGTLSANLSATQAFTKTTSQEVSLTAQPGETLYVYTSEAVIGYYVAILPVVSADGQTITGWQKDRWAHMGSDIIRSGHYIVTNAPVEGDT